MKELLTGSLVRLSAFDADEVGKAFSGWSRDSEFWRLMSAGVAQVPSARQATNFFNEEFAVISSDTYSFAVRTLADDRLIGEMGLDVINWSVGDAFVGLSIGRREDWGKGYGTEMMRLILQFAFCELNLRRVSLTVFEYNPRAIRAYEKAGFRHEGRLRQLLHKEGRRWDLLYMGILREEWLEANP